AITNTMFPGRAEAIGAGHKRDRTAPTVSINSPVDGATVSGTVTATASASDNVGVTSVQFQIDGANIGSPLTAVPYIYSWDTTGASNGTHIVGVVARDAAGNQSNTGVTVLVDNSGPSTR